MHSPYSTLGRLIRLSVVSVSVMSALTLAVTVASVPTVSAQGGSQIVVTGCVEKDAASSTPVFKLVVPAPNSKIYRLNAPKEIDVASHVGHTVDVSGSVADRQGSREPELTVSKLTMVRDSCPGERQQ